MLARYCNLDKEKVWKLTFPQLNYYLKQCDKHIEFTVKVSSLGIQSIFGGGSGEEKEQDKGTEKREDGEYDNGYKVADVDDMMELARLL